MSARARSRSGSVFIDTHGLVATLNDDDAHHDSAVEMFACFVRERTRVFTSDWVLAEFMSVTARRGLRSAAAGIVTDLQASSLTTIIEASRIDWEKAFRLFRARKDKDWSFVDCTSLVLCAERGIKDVLTHDHHFLQARLRILLP